MMRGRRSAAGLHIVAAVPGTPKTDPSPNCEQVGLQTCNATVLSTPSREVHGSEGDGPGAA